MAIDKHATIRGMVKDKPRRTDDLLQKKKKKMTLIIYSKPHMRFKEQEWIYELQER